VNNWHRMVRNTHQAITLGQRLGWGNRFTVYPSPYPPGTGWGTAAPMPVATPAPAPATTTAGTSMQAPPLLSLQDSHMSHPPPVDDLPPSKRRSTRSSGLAPADIPPDFVGKKWNGIGWINQSSATDPPASLSGEPGSGNVMQLIPVAPTPPLARMLCNYANGAKCVHDQLGWDTRIHHLCSSCRTDWHQGFPQCCYFFCCKCNLISQAVPESSSAGSTDASSTISDAPSSEPFQAPTDLSWGAETNTTSPAP